MSLTDKEKYDVNNMNVAAQNISMGNLLDAFNDMTTAGCAVFGNVEGYSKFETDGTLVFAGSAIVWDDLFFPFTSAKQGQTDKPAFSSSEIGYIFPVNDASQIMYMIIQFPHSWAIGTSVSPHIHWKQTQAGSPTFILDYKWFNIGAEVPASFTTYTMSTPETTYITGNTHQLTTGSAHVSGSHITGVSSLFLAKLYRNTGDAYSGSLVAYQFDIHMQKDTIGSKEELSK